MTTDERLAALERWVWAYDNDSQRPAIKPPTNPAVPPAPTQPPAPTTPFGGDPVLGERYGSIAALSGHLSLITYPRIVTVDGKRIWPGSPPEQRYYTNAIGLITRTPPEPATVTPPSDPNVVQVGSSDPSQIDPHSLSDEDWHFFVRNPWTWALVAVVQPYLAQHINSHSNGGAQYQADWDESRYTGRFKRG